MTRRCLIPRDARSRQRVGVMERKKEGRLSLLLPSFPFPLALPWTALLSYETNRRLGTRWDSRFLPCLGGPNGYVVRESRHKDRLMTYTDRGCKKHRRPTKRVGYFAQRGRLPFSRKKKQLVLITSCVFIKALWFSSQAHAEFVYVQKYVI